MISGLWFISRPVVGRLFKKLKIMQQIIIDYDTEMIITRELVFDVIKKLCNKSNHFDNLVFQKLNDKYGYYYEDDTEFDKALRMLPNEGLELILLDIDKFY